MKAHPFCAPANGYVASHLHSAVGEILLYRDSELISRAKLSSVANGGAVRAVPFAQPLRLHRFPQSIFPAAGHAYVGRTQGVAEFFRTALNDLAGVSQDGYCLSLIVRQL